MNPAQPATHENAAIHAPPARLRTGTVVAVVTMLAVAFVVLLIGGLVARSRHATALASTSAQAAVAPPTVAVVHPVAAATADWALPANTQAFQDATVYARVSGYLSKRYVDMGDRVKAGQLLAEIQSPELDQQLGQARANLDQSAKQLDLQKTSFDLAKVTLKRYQSADKAVAQEAIDQSAAAYSTAQTAVAAAQATVDAARANVQQFEAMTAFERVVAPFDGVITQRNVDVGALITAGSPVNNVSAAPNSVAGSATGLFEVSQTDTLRVFVSVPQAYAANIKPGMAARITARGAQEAPAAATVTRISDALDPATRTLLAEIDVPNQGHTLFAGEFVYVTLRLEPAGHRWNVPATALIFNAAGTQVMRVGADNRLQLQKVTVGRDFGATLDIQAGVSGEDTIVEQPDVSLTDGQLVAPVQPQHPAHK